MFKDLFIEWKLDTWANILEIVGFLFSLGIFVLSLFIKSEINKLKTSFIFDRRIKKHIENLKKSASEINQLLNNYNDNRKAIRTEFGNCISEIEDLIPKISYNQSRKSRRLSKFLKNRKRKPFINKERQLSPFLYHISKYPKSFYQTTYDDVWIVYDSLIEIIRQMENLKLNKDRAL